MMLAGVAQGVRSISAVERVGDSAFVLVAFVTVVVIVGGLVAPVVYRVSAVVVGRVRQVVAAVLLRLRSDKRGAAILVAAAK